MEMSPKIRASIFLAIGLVVAGVAAARFIRQWQAEPLFPSPFVTKTIKLSQYHPPLKGTHGDTDVHIFESGVPGGTLLICGGTHPNEPAAYMAAVTILENLRVTSGRVILIPRANNTGFQHNDSQEAMPQRYHFETPAGTRFFRHGSRLTNPVRQWPDPSIYINPRGDYWPRMQELFPDHAVNNPGPGGQMIAGVDSRNLNRVYPGDPNGTLTEQIGHAILTLIIQEEVDLAVDYHEASPEYPTINVMVAHQRAQGITSWAELLLADDGIDISTDSSSLRLRGLSHREWGDAADVLSVLFESTNVVQGRLKGRTHEDQITKGYDEAYIRVQMIQDQLNERLEAKARELEAQGRVVVERSRKILNVRMPPEGVPMEVRVGRHVGATLRLVEAFNDEHPDKFIELENLPSYQDIKAKGMGHYLHGPKGERPAAAAPRGSEQPGKPMEG